MDFRYKIEANVEVGQNLYGIICCSSATYEGVYAITVADIYFDLENIVFDIDQPCGQVRASFSDMKHYVFETREEAEDKLKKINIYSGEGLYTY